MFLWFFFSLLHCFIIFLDSLIMTQQWIIIFHFLFPVGQEIFVKCFANLWQHFIKAVFCSFWCVTINTLCALGVHLRTQRNIALQTRAFALAPLLAKKLLDRTGGCCFLAMR
jgi:hypothetical protein